MADYSSIVTVKNEVNLPTLDRNTYELPFGNWVTPPRPQIGPGENDVFSAKDTGNGTEGTVNYTSTAGRLSIYFKCASTGNRAAADPAYKAYLSFNRSGTPLSLTVQMLDDSGARPH